MCATLKNDIRSYADKFGKSAVVTDELAGLGKSEVTTSAWHG